ncbi:hypothetical protein J4214_01540 [Candidatus Woesearchaeota archaeon]|nr:hypothetical protein [Candidatus Woesearchaeota archaeon]
MENNEQKEKELIVKFKVINNNIQTQVTTKNVTPQEAIGLLETAKDQLLENLRKNRKELFTVKNE